MENSPSNMIDLLLSNWTAAAGALSAAGAASVLWLSTKFPRRREFDERMDRLQQRLDALEANMDNRALLMQKIAGNMEGLDGRLKSLEEKLGWRFAALENQVTILLRGHLEMGE